MKSPRKAVKNVAELAKKVSRSKRAIAKWFERPDWRWGKGPWGAAALKEIRAWCDQLQPNRNYRAGKLSPETAQQVASAPIEELADISPNDLSEILQQIRKAGNLTAAELVKKRIAAFRAWRLETERAGQFVEVKKVKRQIDAAVLTLRGNLMDLPQRINQAIEVCDDNAAARLRIIEKEVHRVMQQMADDFAGIKKSEILIEHDKKSDEGAVAPVAASSQASTPPTPAEVAQ